MYEQQSGAVATALANTNATVFNAETIALIIDLATGPGDNLVKTEAISVPASGQVTVPAGTELAFLQSSDTIQTSILAPTDAKVVLFQGAAGVSAIFAGTGEGSAPGTADRVVVGTAAADLIVIVDGKNTQITAGANDTVVAGAGNDTIVAGLGNSTVEGGTGYAIVQLDGDMDDYTVTVSNGNAIVTNDNGVKTTVSGIQFVQLDNGEALVFAKNDNEAAVSAMYEATFGRSADAYGLEYWFDRVNDGASLGDIADAFVNSAEFVTTFGAISNNTFVQNLYTHTLGRTATAADLAYWGGLLNTGKADRGALVESFSNLTVDIINNDSNEITVVGGITIVNGIV